jgi:hypothetical protein
MTGQQFAALLARIGWSGRELARRLDMPGSTIRAMSSGASSVHPAVSDYLERVAAAIERVPLPDPADRRYG